MIELRATWGKTFPRLLPCLLLAACTGVPKPIGSDQPLTLHGREAPSQPKEGAIDWNGRGQEPFWSLKISGLETELRQPGFGFTKVAKDVQIERPAIGTTIAKFISDRASYLTATRIDGICIDQATGAPFPYALHVQSGEQNLSGCGGTTEEYLAQGEWVVEDVDGQGVVDGGEPRIEFRRDGTVILNTLCRKVSGKYAVQGAEVTFEFRGIAHKSCEPPALKLQEDRLRAATSIRLTLGVEASEGLSLRQGERRRLLLRR